jgi:hypothetical protein
MATAVDVTGYSEDALHLKNLLDGAVDRVVSVYQSYNVPLPSRQYWTMGTAVVDCEQMVVAFNQLYLGAPGVPAGEPQRCNVPRTVTLTITIAREFPVVGQNGRPPSGEKIQQASNMAAIDSWILMESVREFDMWDDTGYGLGVIATLDAQEPQGGFQMVSMEIVMAVP